MNEALVPLAVGGIFVTVLVFSLRARKRMMMEFAVWSAARGLTARAGSWWATPFEAEGVLGGRRVVVNTFTTGAGKSKTTWLAVAVMVGGGGRMELSLVRQGFGTKISEWFGAKETTVGDAAFDARWFIRTNRPEFVQTALLPEIRARIDEVAALGGRSMKLEMKAGWVKYVEQGGVTKKSLHHAERAIPLLEELAALAEIESGA